MSTPSPESAPKKKKSKRKKKFWTNEKILSLSAIFMSACTLLVLIYQTNLMRQQQAMSVYPHLQLINNGTNSPKFKYSLTNTGVGPALIKSVTINYKGKVHEMVDLATHLARTIPEDSLNYSHSNIMPGQLIPPNNTIHIAELNSGGSAAARKLYSYIHDKELEFEIEYASIYGDKWMLSKKRYVPEKLE